MAGKKLGRAKPTMRAGTTQTGDDTIANAPRKRNRTKDKDNPSDTKKSDAPAKRERKGPTRWNIPSPKDTATDGMGIKPKRPEYGTQKTFYTRNRKKAQAALRTSDRENVNRIRQAMRDIQDAPYKFSRTEPQQFTGIEQFKKDQHRKAKSEGFILTGENTKVYFGDKELKAIADLPKPDMHDICLACGHQYALHTSHEDRPSAACVNVTRIPGRRSVINCLCKGFIRVFPEARCAVCTHTYSRHSKAGAQGQSCTTRIPTLKGEAVCTCSAFVHQMPDAEQGGIPMPDSITMTGCELEYDVRRGVLYVHGPHGGTVVRISQLPSIVDIRKYGNCIDVNMGHNARETGPDVHFITKRLTTQKWNHLISTRQVKDLSKHLPDHFLMFGQTMRALVEYDGQIWIVIGWQTSDDPKSAFVEMYLTHEYDAAIEKAAAQKKEREQFRSDANKTRLGD